LYKSPDTVFPSRDISVVDKELANRGKVTIDNFGGDRVTIGRTFELVFSLAL
jgi:hypothetical protein